MLLFMLTLFACKKEDLVEGNSDLKIYNFTADECVVTSDASFLLSGTSTLTKIDVNGNVSWKKNNYFADHTLPLANGDFISCSNSGDTTLYIVKYDANGTRLTAIDIYMYDLSAVIDPRAVELSTGELMIFGTNNFDDSLSIIKTDRNLDPIWGAKVKLNSEISIIKKIKEVSPDGNVVLIGNTDRVLGKNKITYAMVDSNGFLQWDYNKTFGIWENYPTDIQKINDQEYIITGYFDQGGNVDFDFQFFALKIDDGGGYVNLFTTGGSKQDYCLSSVYVPSSGDLMMIGMEGRGQNYNDLNLSNMKIVNLHSSFSSVVTDRSYAKLQSCAAMSAIYNSDGSMSVIGKKNAFENKNLQNVFFLKIKPDGSF